MSFDFLTPVPDTVLNKNQLHSKQTLGHKLKIHTTSHGMPDLSNVNIAILGVPENRNAVNYVDEFINLDPIREAFYALFIGSWNTTIADLGNLNKGKTVEDTYFALQNILSFLLKQQIIPIILGGSQDLTYVNYRAYDGILPMINIANIDSRFDIGDASKTVKNDCFVGKIILDKPYNLFNYANLGYQTYFNSQEEIDLMEKLYFEAYRLGQINNNLMLVEPVMRDTNLVSIDINSIKSNHLSNVQNNSPNGFSAQAICTIARYAGISNKVSSFGIYEYRSKKNQTTTSMLLAQMIWYFIEGVNCRITDDNFIKDNHHQKFITLTDEQELTFYKSTKSERWWIEVPFFENTDNKLKQHTLLPCTHQDYQDALHNKIPERWYKAYKKSLV